MFDSILFIHAASCISMSIWLLIALYEWNANYYVRAVNSKALWFGGTAAFGYSAGAIFAILLICLF